MCTSLHSGIVWSWSVEVRIPLLLGKETLCDDSVVCWNCNGSVSWSVRIFDGRFLESSEDEPWRKSQGLLLLSSRSKSVPVLLVRLS